MRLQPRSSLAAPRSRFVRGGLVVVRWLAEPHHHELVVLEGAPDHAVRCGLPVIVLLPGPGGCAELLRDRGSSLTEYEAVRQRTGIAHELDFGADAANVSPCPRSRTWQQPPDRRPVYRAPRAAWQTRRPRVASSRPSLSTSPSAERRSGRQSLLLERDQFETRRHASSRPGRLDA